MKRAWIAGLLVAVAWVSGLVRAHEHGVDGKSVTLQGEVLDMACYAMHEAKGASHKKCAKACLLGGAPAGLLTADGSVYLLVDDHEHAKAMEMIKQSGAEQVKVRGKMYKRGNIPVIAVESAQKA